MAGVGAKRRKTSRVPQKKRKCEEPSEEQSPVKERRIEEENNKTKDQYAEKLSEKYGVQFPDDLFWFYEFYEENQDILEECIDLRLTGPYSIINGQLDEKLNLSKVKYHLHSRHYYDTPEMMTVLYSEKNDDGYHIAYFRDSPDELPQILVSNRSKVKGEMTMCGDNLFAATYIYCQECLKKTKDSTKVQKLRNISTKLEEHAKQYGYSLLSNSTKCKERNKKVVTKTFHKVGLVVPVDKTGVGYREVPETDRDLQRMFTKIVNAKDENSKNKAFDELQEIINLVQFANDECDYGMGLELGIDMFVFGHKELHNTIKHLVPLAYQLLDRELYGEILEQHLDERVKNHFIDYTKDS